MSNNIHEILKNYWGYDSFRPLQEDIINAILAGTDTLALLPTGGGKSICFQVPALASKGICIVVSPLVALMRDQVENLTKKGIKAYYLHAAMTKREIDIALDNCVYSDIKFLYISPERLKTDIFIERYKKMKVAFVAIDEAHCISEWGYDFRPPYLEIAELRAIKPEIPFLALTASATLQVQDDIKEKLAFEKTEKTFRKSFNRPNLVYAISHTDDKYAGMLYALKKAPGTAIIYARNRRQTKELSDWLNHENISATFYHAGLSPKVKDVRQTDWLNNKVRVMVATNAFGMGIDKPDVRLVLHAGIPESLEAYYQEAGRAGRDGKKAFAVSLLNEADLVQLERNFEIQFPEIKATINTYHALGNFFQIPIERGFGQAFDFDIVAFCKVYNQKPMDVLVHLKLLQQAGYLELNESVFEKSRVTVLMPYENLYKFMVSNKRLEPILKTLLRLHGGLFDNYVKISEAKMGQALKTEPAEIAKRLLELHKLKIIDYVHYSGKPKIVYTLPRHDKSHVMLNHEFIAQRKKVLKQKLESIKQYANADQRCRGNIILEYFNEQPLTDCGHCDFCLKKGETPDVIYKRILDVLKVKSVSVEELKTLFNTHDQLFRSTFRQMLDDEIIGLENDLVYHCK